MQGIRALSGAPDHGVPHEGVWLGNLSEHLACILCCGAKYAHCGGEEELCEGTSGVVGEAFDDHGGMDLFQGSEVGAFLPYGWEPVVVAAVVVEVGLFLIMVVNGS